MQAYAVSYSKYLISASMLLYTFLAYVALPSGKDVRRTCETLQRLCMSVFTINDDSIITTMPVNIVIHGCLKVKSSTWL